MDTLLYVTYMSVCRNIKKPYNYLLCSNFVLIGQRKFVF